MWTSRQAAARLPGERQRSELEARIRSPNAPFLALLLETARNLNTGKNSNFTSEKPLSVCRRARCSSRSGGRGFQPFAGFCTGRREFCGQNADAADGQGG